jgi:hypothetical protein
LEDPNNFVWSYQKGIVRDQEKGPTGYEEHDWMCILSFIESETKKKVNIFI